MEDRAEFPKLYTKFGSILHVSCSFPLYKISILFQWYGYHNEKTELPANQLVLHKEEKVAFCYVPKSARTTFKILLLHSQGLLPDRYLDYSKYKQPRVAPQLRKILLSSLSSEEQDAAIKDYFKFVMFRHPLERLLSGYRSK